MDFFGVNWHEMFVPQNPLLGIFVRGSLTYIMLFVILRFLLKRQSGVIGIADLLVVVLIADAAQNAMAHEYSSITEGALLVLTIVFWNYFIDWLGFRFKPLRRFTRPPPLKLIENGDMIFRNMQKEMITRRGVEQSASSAGVQNCSELRKPSSRGMAGSASSAKTTARPETGMVGRCRCSF
ncbi:DUF421 domain-containing protein [Microvirga arabica]|uniref:DUF421 domain-containing protein n=1 Tax=Microvirga arabica TaxID=1128671 RepID=UPI003619E9DF